MSYEPLVLLPGLMCDQSVWSPLYPHIDPAVACQVCDYAEANDLADMARRVLAVAPPLFALAGHSMGGRVALELIRQAPARVSRLALLDTGYRARPPGDPGVQEAAKRHELLAVARAKGVRAMAEVWVQGMVAAHRLTDTPLIDAILVMFERKSAEVFACQIQALLDRSDGGTVLQQLRVPTLLMCGELDGWAPLEQHLEMQQLAPHAVLECIPQAGHMAPMEQPAAVAAALMRWMGV